MAQDTTETKPYAFRNTSLSMEERVADLINRLTLEEKASQMKHNSPAIERLGIPEYNWWNEALHGVGRSGVATVFPQAIGMGATFDEELIQQVADVISDEARATHNTAVKKWLSPAIQRADLLDSEYQYFQGSQMGERAGNLWGRPFPNRNSRNRIC